ncbi:putative polygalacturonase-like isoform X1 [Hibiscus syriacus]|uniref:Polygalacturonase-like isoform X1 n=1 Tax=Hibiscus syriacus TaxID=106335 RepID=A0A6A2X7D4_HIBSY|nr:putative polygalacturonase-like isoform X1 [Hibiscus syriacus]
MTQKMTCKDSNYSWLPNFDDLSHRQWNSRVYDPFNFNNKAIPKIVESILNIPVQDPAEQEFSSADLTWTKFGTPEHHDDVALIPYARVDEFIIGECSNVECPTRFHIERGRKRSMGSLKDYKSDEYLEFRLYWCSFGPENHGEGGGVLPSRRYCLKTRNRAARPQSMRGCTCHFVVKRLYARPSLALIIFNERCHINKSGFVCHGPLDKDAIGPGAKKVPYISNEIQQQTMSMIYLGIPEENVLEKHIEYVQRYGGSDATVSTLASQYVRKLGMIIKRSTHELDLDDQASIRMWAERNKKSIFFYLDTSETDPFILGIQTKWQLQQMIRFGHRILIAADSTFGIKRLKRLGEIVYSIWSGVNSSVALEELILDFVDQSAFMEYFKSTWVPKVEMWLSTMRTLPLASQEASGAIEAYHVKLKTKLFDDSHLGALQRVDWLVHKLTTELHSAYWLDRYADESDSFLNVKEEYIASTSWHLTLQIPDSAVTLDDKNHLFAKVTSQKDSSRTHLVWNPGSDFAFCYCAWSMQGNFCKHVIMVNMICENAKGYKLSMSSWSFREILMDIWKKPMDDSIGLDESVAWTHQMLGQIKQLVELNNSNDIGIVVNNMPLKWVSKKGRTFVGIPASLPALASSSKGVAKNLQKNQKRKRLSRLR